MSPTSPGRGQKVRKVGGQVPGTLSQWRMTTMRRRTVQLGKRTARSRELRSGRRGAKVRGRGKSRGSGGRKRWGRKGKKPGLVWSGWGWAKTAKRKVRGARKAKLKWTRRGQREAKGWSEGSRAKRTHTHSDQDRILDPSPYRLYSPGLAQTLSAAETHPKAAGAPQPDMGTGPDPQKNPAGGGNRGVSATRMRIPRNRKSQSRVTSQSTLRSTRSPWAHVSGQTGRGPAHVSAPASPAPGYASRRLLSVF